MSNTTIPQTPVYESRARKPKADGRVVGTDNSIWLYRTVPQGSIRDAKTTAESLNISAPLANAFNELAALATTRGVNRSLAKKRYREFHLILTNYPRWYQAPETSPIRSELNRWYRDLQVLDRRVMLGVRLVPTTGDGSVRGFMDSVEQTLFHGGVLESDYDKDFAQVSAAFDRAGLGIPTPADWAAVDGWWNLGDPRPVAELRHAEHMHFFSRRSAWKVAEEEGLLDCEPWLDLPDHRAITFASLAEFDIGYTPVSDAKAWWASDLVGMDARVVSARGFVEPPTITRQELKSQRRKMRVDLEEGYQKGKDQARREEREAEINSIEAQYDIGKNDMPPTIVDLSVVAGLAGIYSDEEAIRVASAQFHIMSNRQLQAWHETMICSNVRGNPNLHDVPATTLAYSGISNFTRVGDDDGAFLGLTHDKQPVYLSPVAASSGDAAPLVLAGAATGAGKLLTLDARIATPTGWVTMGDVQVGDAVLGRDGCPTRVTFVSDICEKPDLYRMTLSDGQVIDADADHQWVVSDFAARTAARKADHRAAVARQTQRLSFASRLRGMAQATCDAQVTYRELFDELNTVPGMPWATKASMYSVLNFMEVKGTPTTRETFFEGQTVTKTDPAKLYSTSATLAAGMKMWQSDRGRWASQSRVRAAAATALLEGSALREYSSTREMARALVAAGAPGTAANLGDALSREARKHGHEATDGFMAVEMQVPTHRRATSVDTVSRRTALNALAGRIEFLAVEEMTLDPRERIVTTSEMLAEGLLATQGQANFAIRLAAPIHVPGADLPVAPYTLGAWLGDGSTRSGGLTGIDAEIWEGVEGEGYTVTHGADGKSHYIKGLVPGLRAAGVFADKRIPAPYLRASYEQRLAVLQGLMDTDGTILKSGSCELSLNKRDLAEDALELVRSLGIKASWSENESSYRLPDGSLKVTGTRHRIKFTTTLPVFRLPRKLERVPSEVRETQKWLYIESIESIASRPGRCIQVDSADSTYLAGWFVPTHNTVLGQWLARQHALMGTPTVFIDPKEGSDLRSAFLDIPGFRVVLFDDLVKSNGGLDPLTLYPTPEEGIPLAADMLFNVNPWGNDDRRKYEAEIANAIRFGVSRGAKVTGQALAIAFQHGQVTREAIEPVFKVAETFPMFRATFGTVPPEEGSTLAKSNSLTLFMRGNAPLTLPPMNRELAQDEMSSVMRQSVNLLRMLVRGSLIALRGRGGVLHMDEAWVLERATPDELNETGRLARSMQVLPIFYTQTPTGPLRLGLKGYFSRGLIGHISDSDEAAAALELFGARRPETHSRVIAPETLAGDQGANWNSLKALWTRDPLTGKRKLLRSTEFMYGDLKQRFAATTVMLPEEFLIQASTTPEDVAERIREAQLRRE